MAASEDEKARQATETERRKTRQAAALRENLRRRKARDRAAAPEPAAEGGE